MMRCGGISCLTAIGRKACPGFTTLKNHAVFTKTSNMMSWERDLGSVYSQEEWKSAIRNCYRYSHCSNHWDLMMKILHRSYLTSVRMSMIFPSEPNECWRQLGARGNIYHILWEWKSIRSFWYEVFKLISSVTGFIVKPLPQLALLSLTVNNIPLQLRSITNHILIAARLTITSKWRTNFVPNTKEVIQRVMVQYSYEKHFAIQSHSVAKFNDQWEPWTSRFQE